MKVIRFDNGDIANRTEYKTDLTDIRQVAAEFGHTEDTLELLTDSGEVVAKATWPQGSKVYKFCSGKDLSPNPAWCVWRY